MILEQEIDEMVESGRNWAWEELNAVEDEPDEGSKMLDTLTSVYEQLNDAFCELYNASKDIEDQGEYERMMDCLTEISNAMTAIHFEKEKRKSA